MTARASECSGQRVSDSLAASVAQPAPPPPVMGNSRKKPRPKQQPKQPREYLRCGQCGAAAGAQRARRSHAAFGTEAGGQTLLEDSVGQLRWLNRQTCMHCGRIRSQWCRQCISCVACGTTRSQRSRRCNLCGNFVLGIPSRTDDSSGIRTRQPAVR